MCTPHSGNIYTSVVKILNPALNYIFILQFKYLYLSENISTRCKNIHLGGNISTLVKNVLFQMPYLSDNTVQPNRVCYISGSLSVRSCPYKALIHTPAMDNLHHSGVG